MEAFFTDPLRLTLAATAVVVLAGIFFFGKRKTVKRYEDEAETNAQPDVVEKSFGEASEGAFFGNDEFVGKARTVARDVEQSTISEKPRPSIKKEEIEEEQFVVLHLVPGKEGDVFTGPDLLQVFRESGLEYGEFKIFHYPHRKDRTKSLFSVVNMLKPGFFDINGMKNFTTTGLSMFLRLPVYGGENEGTFSTMLATANVMARKLRATVLDQNRDPLNEHTTKKIKQYISWYTRQKKLSPSKESIE